VAKASGAGDSKKPATVKKKTVKKAASSAATTGHERAKARTGISNIHFHPMSVSGFMQPHDFCRRRLKKRAG
jgi:hypothetical protein